MRFESHPSQYSRSMALGGGLDIPLSHRFRWGPANSIISSKVPQFVRRHSERTETLPHGWNGNQFRRLFDYCIVLQRPNGHRHKCVRGTQGLQINQPLVRVTGPFSRLTLENGGEFREAHMRPHYSFLVLCAVVVGVCSPGLAQSEVQNRTLVVNDHRGDAVVYRINGKSYVSLETIARIANGSLTTVGNEIHLTLASPSGAAASQAHAGETNKMSDEFLRAAIEELSVLNEWHSTLANAIQQGVPGDGSRFSSYQDRAAHSLSLATISASNIADQNSLRLLQNHFSQVDNWTRKLIQERKAMSTANYSLTPDALDKDAQYQQIENCSKSLRNMLTAGKFEDVQSCH